MLYLDRKQQPQQQQRHGIPLCKAELKIKVILCMFQNKINIFLKRQWCWMETEKI